MFADMLNMMLMLLLVVAPSCLWAYVWVKAYRGRTAGSLILHTVIFSVLSLLIAYLAMRMIFSQVDDTYSASNKGALGLMSIMCTGIFAVACLALFLSKAKNAAAKAAKVA